MTLVKMGSTFGLQTISFAFFGAVFVGASAVASIFILPLLVLSFIFSGLVVVFSGLSYTTFKMASSKYHRTVLLLNKLLRKLADTIPPSVGFQEVPKESAAFLPSCNLLERFESLQSSITGVFRTNQESKEIKTKEPEEPETFQIEAQPTNPPVIHDDRDSLDEEDHAALPHMNGDSTDVQPSDQAVKDGVIDN